jgi:obg-like ATPase 1
LVPDERFDWLVEHYKPKSVVPAHLTIYDIAGLTRGASTGAGLGNAFLSHIRAVDAIFQVVRCFEDAEITHVEGDVDPTRDLDIISEELRIKDAEFVEKALENYAKQTRRGGQSLEMRKLKEEQNTVERCLEMLKDGKDVRKGNWTPKEVRIGAEHTSRPFPSVNALHDDKERSLEIIPALRTPRLYLTLRWS